VFSSTRAGEDYYGQEQEDGYGYVRTYPLCILQIPSHATRVTSTQALQRRNLYGGAITLDIPARFKDVSALREIPDNQEVFVDIDTDQSFILEARCQHGVMRGVSCPAVLLYSRSNCYKRQFLPAGSECVVVMVRGGEG
jgi:hypothetical protein